MIMMGSSIPAGVGHGVFIGKKSNRRYFRPVVWPSRPTHYGRPTKAKAALGRAEHSGWQPAGRAPTDSDPPARGPARGRANLKGRPTDSERPPPPRRAQTPGSSGPHESTSEFLPPAMSYLTYDVLRQATRHHTSDVRHHVLVISFMNTRYRILTYDIVS